MLQGRKENSLVGSVFGEGYSRVIATSTLGFILSLIHSEDTRSEAAIREEGVVIQQC